MPYSCELGPFAGDVHDNGNDNDNDACLNNCESAACGDSVTQTDVEECDDGNPLGDDGCDPDCRKTRKIVFVSSKLFSGNMDGLLGADNACKELGEALPGPKEFRAWLSTKVESPLTRMKHSQYPYVRVDDKPIAPNFAGLVSGMMLVNPIELDETGAVAKGAKYPECEPECVITNTSANGTSGAQDCFGWTSDRGETIWGLAVEVNEKWTDACEAPCSAKAPIYCVQQ